MHTKQFFKILCGALALATAVTLVAGMFVLPAFAQNPVPPTARQAATLPQFASRLHPTAAQAGGKSRASVPTRTPSPQDQVVYENGPANGTTDAWTIDFGYVVSDTFTIPFSSYQTTITHFDFYTWEFPGDVLSSVDWSITSQPNGGTVLGSGTVSGYNLTDTFISTNLYGYNIDKISASGLNVNLNSATYYLNLQNGVVPNGDPIYWDENSGVGCHSQGCPSQAYESAVGTIPSESFDIVGSTGPPPPSCFGSRGRLQIIYDFTGQDLVGKPNGVTIDKAGNLYGPSDNGGNKGLGMAYELSPKGQGWVFTPLYSFTGGSQGAGPGAVIVGPDGALYGNTPNGGLQTCGSNGSSYCGLVYSLRPAPTACLTALCGWGEDVLYQFAGGNDTWHPTDRLVFDQAGNLYGTTSDAVFELTPSTTGWSEQVLYRFDNGSDYSPYSLVFGSDGNLYGGVQGGAYGYGAIFQLVPSENGWTEKDIYSFPGVWGNYTSGPSYLVRDGSGNLYGIAYGFDEGWSSILAFMLSPSNGQWTYSGLFSYQNPYQGYDTTYVNAMAIDAAGDVYFTINHWTPCGSNCSAPAPDDYAWGAVMMRPHTGGGFQDIWDTGQNALFMASGPLATDLNGNVYGTASCPGLGSIWVVY